MNGDLLENIRDELAHFLISRGYSVMRNSWLRGAKSDITFRLPSELNIENENLMEEVLNSEYSLPIGNITVQENLINVHLDRKSTFAKIFRDASFEVSHPKKQLSINCDGDLEEDLTTYRVHLLAQTLRNLSKFLGYEILQNAPQNNLYLSSRSNFSKPLNQNQKVVLCGSVLNTTEKNKETELKVSDVKSIKRRMLLQEMEDRNKVDEEVASLLADAVLKFDLLCIKISKNVFLNTSKVDSGASGSVIFILYNYSRLNAILHQYESRVDQNFYPSLPSVDEIDLGVLKKEEEWTLLRDFVLRFPNVVFDTVKHIDEGKPSPHLLCQFLYSLSRATSSYYRSTQILLDKQPTLIKLTFARIQLVKIIHRILHQGLAMLNIETVPAL